MNDTNFDFSAAGVNRLLDIPYGSHNDRQKLDLLLPQKFTGRLPVILWIHGGGWTIEELNKTDHMPKKQFSELVCEGFIIASVEYTLAQQEPFPQMIKDLKTAVRFLRANADKYGIDPSRVGCWGESAGGHLSSLLAVSHGVAEFEGEEWEAYSSDIQACIVWYGPNDMVEAVFSRPAHNFIWETVYGKPIEEKRELIWASSPQKYAVLPQPPILMVQGALDETVFPSQSTNFCKALTDAGNKAEVYMVADAGHGFFSDEKVYEKCTQFWKENL